MGRVSLEKKEKEEGKGEKRGRETKGDEERQVTVAAIKRGCGEHLKKKRMHEKQRKNWRRCEDLKERRFKFGLRVEKPLHNSSCARYPYANF